MGALVNRPLAGDMFAKSFQPEKQLSQKTKNKLSEAIRNSKQVKSVVNECINEFKTNRDTYCSKDIEFTGHSDLHLSVGKAKVEVQVVQIEDKYWADVTVTDTYDFDEFRKDISFGSIMNNIGFYIQNQNILVPYEWDVNYAVLVE